MLQTNMIEKSGFRALSEDELEVVSGGFEAPNNFGGGHLDDYDYLAAQELSQTYDNFGFNSGVPQLGDGSELIKRFQDHSDVESLMTDHEIAYSQTLQVFGVPGPVANVIAVVASYLSSVEAKQDLERFTERVNEVVQDLLFGPPAQTTGNPAEDVRRALGPIAGPQFPE